MSEVDSFVGQRFGKEGQVEVIKWNGSRTPSGNKVYTVHCSICAKQPELFKDGNFNSLKTRLLLGQLPCRCADFYKWTPDQREQQIVSIIATESLSYTFLGWVDGYVNSRSKAHISCEEHGSWPISVSKFIDRGQRCPKCATSGFNRSKPAYLYILKVVGEHEFCGYGITCDFDRRISTHKKNFKRHGVLIDEYETFHGSGEEVSDIEMKIRQKFPQIENKIEGFIRESTPVHFYMEVVSFVDQQFNLA